MRVWCFTVPLGQERNVEEIAAWVFNLKGKAVRDFTINVI